jgi:ribosomal protein S18 acetylase RimI-like enzyme
MGMVIIKKITKKNVNEVYNLANYEFGYEFWFTKEFVAKAISVEGYHYGAYEDGKLVGFILTEKFDRPKIWILLLVVDEKYRRNHIGSNLLSKVESNMDQNYFTIYVDVGKNDKEANKFYKARGFQKSGYIKGWFGPTVDARIMRKDVKHD